MRRLLLTLTFVAAISQFTPEEYAVDLDLPPEYRYTLLIQNKQTYIKSFLELLRQDDLYASAFSFAHYLRRNLTTLVDQEFYRECQGIANLIGRSA